jgi:hypothetical protein
MNAHLLLAFALSIFLFIAPVLPQQLPLSSAVEKSALLQLRSTLGLRARDWPRKGDPCSNWTGIACRNGSVFGITLTGLRRSRIGRFNPLFSVDSLPNLTSLASFNSSGFSLPGYIPDLFGRFLNALQVLDLSSSSIPGQIPSSLGTRNTINTLQLSHNSLSGSIPSNLGQLSSLSVLDLSHNLLSGSIPVQLANLSNLVQLDIGFNSLSGTLPDDFGRMRNLQNLVLSSNNFNGDFSDSFRSMPRLQSLDISGNNFTGVLPNLSLLFNVTGAMFNFSNNSFYGNLSLQVDNFSFLDLSSNYFQGPAPNNSGTGIEITGNCFSRVPNQRNPEDCRTFYANRGLIFNNDDSLNPTEPSRSNRRFTFIMIGIFGGIGFFVLLFIVLVLLFKFCYKRNEIQGANSNVVPVLEIPPQVSDDFSVIGESFTYKQMLEATSDFSDKNLMKHGRSGDLYWGKLEEGFSVVIKKIDVDSLGTESYTSELDILHKVVHTRLVPLLGHCLENDNEKFLVYKYMSYGDLSNSLHGFIESEDGVISQSLDWITRLKIAMGAAEGLAYLHHECNPPLVHGDVQASSILLDDKYEVRIGSLSQTRVQEFNNHQTRITRFLRKPQTSEQGSSGLPTTSCAYDVYCFGKVLLELVTGKMGLSKEWLDQNLPLININDKVSMAKIVDQSLIVDEDLLEEVWAVAIVGKSCLNPKASKRPIMRHIVKALENPFRVVRQDSFASSRKSWNAVFFGSWRQGGSSESSRFAYRDELKHSGRGASMGSSSHKMSSSEVFPESIEIQDSTTPDENRR